MSEIKTASKIGSATRKRTRIPETIRLEVLTEAGYRCAVPTCRSILAVDLHHLEQVCEGGGNDASNLIALCPTCHALYHRGTIKAESIYAYKAMLVAISHAYDLDAIDKLLFLSMHDKDFLVVSGDGALHFAHLVAGGLASLTLKANNQWLLVTYAVNLSERGVQLIQAWKAGDRSKLVLVLAEFSQP